jgi:flagellar basal body-associated protein FliL
MAKKKSGDEAEAKGGGKKKIIIVAVALVGAFGAKTMLMKPPNAAEKAAAKLQQEQQLTALCQRQNTPESGAAAPAEESTTTTVAAAAAPTATTEAIDPSTERGGVLELDPLTVNLADGHYLKVGLALQLDKTAGADVAKAKDEGLGAKALDMAIAALSPKTMDQLGQAKVRDQLKQQLGLDACQAYEGEVLTVYFTNFVMQ